MQPDHLVDRHTGVLGHPLDVRAVLPAVQHGKLHDPSAFRRSPRPRVELDDPRLQVPHRHGRGVVLDQQAVVCGYEVDHPGHARLFDGPGQAVHARVRLGADLVPKLHQHRLVPTRPKYRLVIHRQHFHAWRALASSPRGGRLRWGLSTQRDELLRSCTCTSTQETSRLRRYTNSAIGTTSTPLDSSPWRTCAAISTAPGVSP